MDDLIERVAKAIWTAPLSGQPPGFEVRSWPPAYKATRAELRRQAAAAIAVINGGDK